MSAADRERIEAIRLRLLRLANEDAARNAHLDSATAAIVDAMRDAAAQLSALSEALSAANNEIARLKATTT